MLMKDDKKRHVAIIIKKMKGTEMMEPAETNEAGDEVDKSSAEDHAVAAMMKAMKEENASDFKEALKAFVEMCYDHENEEE